MFRVQEKAPNPAVGALIRLTFYSALDSFEPMMLNALLIC